MGGYSGTTKIEANLYFILNQLREQSEIAAYFPPDIQSVAEQIAQIDEFIDLAGEYELGYEYIISLLVSFPFRLSGVAAVKLLETGLILELKTKLPEKYEALFGVPSTVDTSSRTSNTTAL